MVFSQWRARVSAVFCMVFNLNMPWAVSALRLSVWNVMAEVLPLGVSVSLTCVV